jgi:hypothetical protein
MFSQLPADCGSQILEKAFISRVGLVGLDMTRLGVGIAESQTQGAIESIIIKTELIRLSILARFYGLLAVLIRGEDLITGHCEQNIFPARRFWLANSLRDQ